MKNSEVRCGTAHPSPMEFFKQCEVGDVCSEEDVIVNGRSHFHCLLCQALVHSASKLQDHCIRHANAKSVPQEHEMCVKHFTRFMPTCSQNCLLSQTATKHRHCKLCGGAHTDPDSRGLGQHVERWHIRHYTEVKEIVDLARRLRNYICPGEGQQEQEKQQHQHIQQQAVETVQVQGQEMGHSGDATTMPQAVFTQGEVPPGSWQTSTTQMTDGSLATVHHWTGETPPVYPPNCTLQSIDQSQQPSESYILQEHSVSHTGSEFVIQEAAAQSGVDAGYTLQVETSTLNPSQEAASIILQMMDRAQMPADNHSTAQANHQQQRADDTPFIPKIVSETSPQSINRSSRKQEYSENTLESKLTKQRDQGASELNQEGDAPILVLKSRPLPGTVIDPIVVQPKVWQQCLVCGSSSYLRTLRVCSEGNRRHMNKAQTARLMTFYKLAVDPTLPGKLICKKDYEAWLIYDKKLQQLLTAGDDDKLQKDSDGLMIKTSVLGRRHHSAAKKSKSEPPLPYTKARWGKTGKPVKSGMQIRVPRSKRLRERMEKQTAADASDNDENKSAEEMNKQGDQSMELGKDGHIEENETPVESEQVVIVSLSGGGGGQETQNEKSKIGEMQYKVIVTVPETCQVDQEPNDESGGAEKQEGNSNEENMTIVTTDR